MRAKTRPPPSPRPSRPRPRSAWPKVSRPSAPRDQLYLHLTGTDFLEPLANAELEALKPFWQVALESESGQLYRGEYLAGEVLARLGVVPQQIPGSDIYPALEKGTIDAAEWIGPYDDQKLGFNKVAKYYYYPGFWEGGPQISMYINIKQWQALPKEYQTILEDACLYAHAEMQARYDAKNPTALKQLIGSGTQLRPFPNDVMAAAYKAAHELYDETAKTNPKFKKIYDSWKKFRDDQIQWFAVAENRFDNFMQAARSAAAKSAKP